MDRLLSAKKVAGIKQTKNAIITGDAIVVYIAEDVDPSIKKEVSVLCDENNIEIVSVGSRKELAKACRIDVPCAVAAVLKN